jgi:cell division protein FtsX
MKMKNKKGIFETENVVRVVLLIIVAILVGAAIYYIKNSVLS